MTNKLYTFIAELKRTLKDLSTFKKVGEYPADVDMAKVSGNAPSILIQEGDEELAEVQMNQTLNKVVKISIWLYHDTDKSRIKTITDRQIEIETAILSSDFLTDSGAFCIEWASVEKGEHLDDFTGYDVGYDDKHIVRKINFDVILDVGR